jgi:hypothetical protein
LAPGWGPFKAFEVTVAKNLLHVGGPVPLEQQIRMKGEHRGVQAHRTS